MGWVGMRALDRVLLIGPDRVPLTAAWRMIDLPPDGCCVLVTTSSGGVAAKTDPFLVDVVSTGAAVVEAPVLSACKQSGECPVREG